MISLVLMAEDQSPRRITACESDVVCTVMRQQYGEEFDGVLFGDEPIPEGDSFEDHAIEDGARLGVLLKPPVGFVAGDVWLSKSDASVSPALSSAICVATWPLVTYAARLAA